MKKSETPADKHIQKAQGVALKASQGASSSSGVKLSEDSYKRKQDQIIEMIQSNMKRSEDIQ